MAFSNAQKEIIKDIADKNVKDLITFYTKHFDKLKEESIATDITGWSSDKPKLPDYCSMANTIGIVLEDEEMEKVIGFISLWKGLEKDGLIYSYEKAIDPFLNKHLCFIPLYPINQRTIGKYNNDAFNLTKDFLNKVIVCTEDLNIFVKKGFKNVEERKEKWTRIIAMSALVISFLGIMSNVAMQIVFNSKERKIEIIKDSTINEPRKIYIINQQKDSSAAKKDSIK